MAKVRIATARVGDDEDSGIFDSARLLAADDGAGHAGEHSISSDSDEYERAWTITSKLASELETTSSDIVAFELPNAARRSRDQIDDSDILFEEQMLFLGREEAWGEAGFVQNPPEWIGGIRKMMVCMARPRVRVDANEERLEIRPNDIRNDGMTR